MGRPLVTEADGPCRARRAAVVPAGGDGGGVNALKNLYLRTTLPNSEIGNAFSFNDANATNAVVGPRRSACGQRRGFRAAIGRGTGESGARGAPGRDRVARHGQNGA